MWSKWGFSVKYAVVAGEARKAQAGDAPYMPGVSKAELARRHAREKVDRDLEAVRGHQNVVSCLEIH
jgi:hypothetical protein